VSLVGNKKCSTLFDARCNHDFKQHFTTPNMALNDTMFQTHVTELTVLCLLMVQYLWLLFSPEACLLPVICSDKYHNARERVNFSDNSICNLQTRHSLGLLVVERNRFFEWRHHRPLSLVPPNPKRILDQNRPQLRLKN